MRPAAPAASGRSRCRSSQRRREVVPTDWEGLHPPPWWREIGATLAVRWHRRKMPTATVGTKRRRQLVPVDSTISPPPRGTHRAGRDGVDGERSPLLRWLENYLRAVVRAQRASPHPLNLPVPVATRSYGRRVFACASSSSMRTSKSLGSSHSSAFSRRCRAMSTARMIKLARARTSDVAYPNTCFHLHESLSNPWARTVGLSRADSDNGSVASKRSKSLASGLSYSELGLEAPPPRSSRKDRSTYLWPRPPVRTQSGLGASGAAS